MTRKLLGFKASLLLKSSPNYRPPLASELLSLNRVQVFWNLIVQKLPDLVAAAETAIFKRLQAMSQAPDNQAERQAIEDALANLRTLKRDSLGFPDWEKK